MIVGMAKPDISYPCRWVYRVIGGRAEVLRQAVTDVLGDHEHVLTPSNTSRNGKYASLRLEVVVADDDQREGIYRALCSHESIRIVL
jgi:putative lipoic acid-binding regulatory protein